MKASKSKGSYASKDTTATDTTATDTTATDTTATATRATNEPDSSKDSVGVKATGLTMLLGGVDPLDLEALAEWEEVTRDFIEDDITRLNEELDQLEVSVIFDFQDPPYEGETRQLKKTEVRGTHAQARTLVAGLRIMKVEIAFDIAIEILSEAKNHNANRYVAHAFSSDTRKSMYMRKLLATGNPAFANVGTVSVDANLPTPSAELEGKEIGAIVGFAILGVVCLATIFFILYGTRSGMNSNDEDSGDSRDQASGKQAKTDTVSVSSEEDGTLPPEAPSLTLPHAIMSGDEASLASHYYDGNISVAWSMATDIPQTPRIANQKGGLLGALSRESSDGSLYAEDGIEVPITSPQQTPSMVVSPLEKVVDPAVVTPLQEQRKFHALYEI